MDEKELLKVFDDLDRLKHSEREGWKQKNLESPLDTISSHSHGSAVLGWLIAESEGLDSDRIVKMLLAHDLMMSRIPDLTPEDDDYEKKEELEEKALEEMRAEYPSEAEEIFELIDEFRQRDTDDAKIAKKADKLDTLMQARKYSEKTEEDLLEEFRESFREYFQDATLADKIFENIGPER